MLSKMKSIAIYGTGSCANKLIRYLNKDYIKFFVETCPTKSFFRDLPVISLDKLKRQNLNYDFLIIASSFKNEILELLEKGNKRDDRVIIFEESYIEYFYSDKDLKNQIDRFNHNNFEAIALGLSYTRDGIKSELYNKNIINLSYSSQDLLADYAILEYLESEDFLGGVKSLILGLGYYSFNHDMSKTKYKNVISRYLTLSTHNRMNIIDENYMRFRRDLSSLLLDLNTEEIENVVSNKYHTEKINKQRIIEGIEVAKKHSKMNRIQTRKENLIYLTGILDICSRNSIKVIITIFPTEKNYYNYISPLCKKNFYDALNALKYKSNFEVIDLLESPEFSFEDFWDTSHLNIKGAKKMVKIIEPYLK